MEPELIKRAGRPRSVYRPCRRRNSGVIASISGRYVSFYIGMMPLHVLVSRSVYMLACTGMMSLRVSASRLVHTLACAGMMSLRVSASRLVHMLARQQRQVTSGSLPCGPVA
jgi:hypothetical protein